MIIYFSYSLNFCLLTKEIAAKAKIDSPIMNSLPASPRTVETTLSIGTSY